MNLKNDKKVRFQCKCLGSEADGEDWFCKDNLFNRTSWGRRCVNRGAGENVRVECAG
jgi:hypothetical protein